MILKWSPSWCKQPLSAGRVELPTKFSKKRWGSGLEKMSIFVGSLLRKRGDIFQEGCKFYIKSKLKSEMLNEIFIDKKRV